MLFQAQLREWGLLNESDVNQMEVDIAAEIEDAVRFAESSPWEPVENLLHDVQGQATP